MLGKLQIIFVKTYLEVEVEDSRSSKLRVDQQLSPSAPFLAIFDKLTELPQTPMST